MYGVSTSAISLALRGHTWRRAGGVGRQGQLTQEQVSLLRQMRSETGASADILADHFRISPSQVRRILRQGLPRVEVRPRCKLTEGDVVAIRTLYQGGKHSCATVAQLYEVTSSLIYQIVNRKIWKHL